MTNILKSEVFLEGVYFIDSDGDLYLKNYWDENYEAERFQKNDIGYFNSQFQWSRNGDIISDLDVISKNKIYNFIVPANSMHKVICSLIKFLS